MYIRRKVYSNQGDEYVPVNETYFNERLYSVTMSEEELVMFSDFCDELEYLLFR